MKRTVFTGTFFFFLGASAESSPLRVSVSEKSDKSPRMNKSLEYEGKKHTYPTVALPLFVVHRSHVLYSVFNKRKNKK